MNRTQMDELNYVLAQLETDSSLFETDQVYGRIAALDRLDATFGVVDHDLLKPEPDEAAIYERVASIRARLEDVNSEFYESIRAQIRSGTRLDELFRWMWSSCHEESEAMAPGLNYDHLDEVVSGVLQFEEPGTASLHPDPEMVFYQPTPVRHVLDLISSNALSESDVLFDLGAGLGHVPILVSIFTGARCVGIEIDPAFIASAQGCVRRLGLSRVTFIHGDARTADLSNGTVFYLYSPFKGTILSTVLRRLEEESANRPIRICTFGPCTLRVADEPWLEVNVAPVTDRIVTFVRRA